MWFPKKKFLGNLATLVHFISQKSFIWVAMEFFILFFCFWSHEVSKFCSPRKKIAQKMQLKPNSMCCWYVANNSYQLDQISHACNFITPCVMEISFLPTYDSHDRGSHAHKVIYIYIYILTLTICSWLKKHTCSSYVFSNLW